MTLQFQVCFQAALKANVNHNLPYLTPAVQNDQRTFNSSHSQRYRHAEYVFFELPASTIHYFFILQLLSFLLPTTNLYKTAVQTSFC